MERAVAGRAAFLAGSSKLMWPMENKAPWHSFLPDPLHLRKGLCVLSSALWSGILVPSPFSQAKNCQLTVQQEPQTLL